MRVLITRYPDETPRCTNLEFSKLKQSRLGHMQSPTGKGRFKSNDVNPATRHPTTSTSKNQTHTANCLAEIWNTASQLQEEEKRLDKKLIVDNKNF